MAGSRKPRIAVKRAYEPRARGDGTRVLVERLWPRGLTKEEAAIDLWLKEVSPSPELRRWYGHELEKWPEFRRRYRAELAKNLEPVRKLEALGRRGPVTLVYAARDAEHNSARVLLEFLEEGR